MKTFVNLIAVVAVLASTLFAFDAQPLRANDEEGLWFRNSTNSTIWLVIQYYPKPPRANPGERMAASMPQWQTVGWYKVPAQQTVQILPTLSSYGSRFYYYAYNERGEYWNGNSTRTLWIKNTKFHTSDGTLPEYLTANGYYSVVANEINTTGYSSWLAELSD